MTVGVTGSTGFLGSRVVASLLARHHDVRCAIRSERKGAALAAALPYDQRRRLQLLTGSLASIEFCREFVRHCDVVVHVASPLQGSASILFAQGVLPTRVLASAAERSVRRFVLISSLGVYGTQHLRAGEVLDERCPVDSQPHHRDPYTYSKVVQEAVCWEMHRERGVPLVVIRPGVLFGPGRPLVTGRVGLSIGNLLVQMGGQRAVPLCFVDNCAGAVASAVDVPGIDGMSFNVVDDELPTTDEVVRLHRASRPAITRIRVPAWAIGPLAHACWRCSKWSGGLWPPVITPYKAAALWKPLRFSNALAKDRLRWRPLVGFTEAVQRIEDDGPAETK
jgi:nucleoside-diphosphate-sugar epimerase